MSWGVMSGWWPLRKPPLNWTIMPWRAVAPATATTLSTCICWFCVVAIRVASAAFTGSPFVMTSSPVPALFPIWNSSSAASTVLNTNRNSSLVILFGKWDGRSRNTCGWTRIKRGPSVVFALGRGMPICQLKQTGKHRDGYMIAIAIS